MSKKFSLKALIFLVFIIIYGNRFIYTPIIHDSAFAKLYLYLGCLFLFYDDIFKMNVMHISRFNSKLQVYKYFTKKMFVKLLIYSVSCCTVFVVFDVLHGFLPATIQLMRFYVFNIINLMIFVLICFSVKLILGNVFSALAALLLMCLGFILATMSSLDYYFASFPFYTDFSILDVVSYIITLLVCSLIITISLRKDIET